MIAIHKTGSFAKRWIEYCKANDINYKVVNAYDNDIILQLKNCDALMWHHDHGKYKDVLTAKKILFALEHAGIKVFPNFNTGWHFDDKVAQKYLLEAIGAPLVPSYVFYDKKEAIEWANKTTYPKVFKLKGGAGSANVRLVKSKLECLSLINKAFGRGFKQFDGKNYFLDTIKKYKSGKKTLKDVIKAFGRMLISTDYAKNMSPEKGYVYFQDFIPNNKTDFRIKIVNNRCWGFQRKVRANDFRASGSGDLIFDNTQIPKSMIETAFKVYNRLQLQSVAFDFVLLHEQPLIVEISYGFGIDEEEFQNGYWDSNLNWHEGVFNPQEWMVENLINELTIK